MIDQLLKRYKNTIILVVIAAGLVFFLKNFYQSQNNKLNVRQQQVQDVKEKIELIKTLDSAQATLSRLQARFLRDDQYRFLNRISSYSEQAGLSVISIQPHETSLDYLSKEIRPLAVVLEAKDSFQTISRFLQLIDKDTLKIEIVSVRFNPFVDKNDKQLLRARFEIVGLGLE